MRNLHRQSTIEMYAPKDFNFEECLVFLGRSQQELLHKINEGSLYKLLKLDQEFVLLKIEYKNHKLNVEFLLGEPSENARKLAAEYISEWFDLERDLTGFYEMAQKDKVLKNVVTRYKGLRLIGIPDLFESLTWAIMGQQINLKFAYTLKKRFVERFGESITFEGETYWLYPSFERIAEIDSHALREEQFTARKTEYIIGIAKLMLNVELSKESLLKKQTYQEIHDSLTEIRGIGAWTADYVMMKSLQQSTALPLTDVGLHNALKIQLGMDVKPSITKIREMASSWKGWEAYSVFYLWRSLYD
jgi:DNA-3-methyladenine glycosylase II